MKKNLLAITVCFMVCLLLAECGETRAETGSSTLGTTALIVRIVSCFLCGCAAGLLVFVF